MRASPVSAPLTIAAVEPSRAEPEAPPRFARGVIAITFAKLWFVIAGYGIFAVLTRTLGPRDFGLYAVVTSIVSVVNNALISVTVRAVARFTARDERSAGSVLRSAMLLLMALGMSIFVALEILASPIAAWLHDPDLAAPLRVVALVVPAYALYAVNVGFLNGLRRFQVQAVLDSAYSTLRAGLQIGAVALGLGVMGAVSGFAAAAALIVGASAVVVRRAAHPKGPFQTREMIHFAAWFAGLTLAANLMLAADLWIVKWLSPPAIANQQVGLYRAALTISQLLYQLLIPLALVIFPHLSHLGHAPDPERARNLVRDALRYLALSVLPGAALISVMGGEILGLLYDRAYVPAGAWLDALGPAYAAWTIAYVLAVALSGAGYVRSGLGVALVGLSGQAIAAALLCARFGPHGAAWGDVVGMTLALAVGLPLAIRRFGDIIPWASVARGAALAVLLALVASRFPASGWLVPAKGLALAVAAVLLLIASGELKLPGRMRGIPETA